VYRFLLLAVVVGVSLLAAHYVRHHLIEPVAMGIECPGVSNFASTWRCSLREFAIWALQHSRLGWSSLALICIAYFSRQFVFAVLAVSIAGVGVVLYTPELCAIALLSAGLLALRATKKVGHSQAGNAMQSQ
jgi:hypothetical protein